MRNYHTSSAWSEDHCNGFLYVNSHVACAWRIESRLWISFHDGPSKTRSSAYARILRIWSAMLQPTPESTTLLMRSLIYLANKYPCEYFNQLFTIRSTVRKSCSLHSGSEVHSQTNPFTARVVGTVWEPWSMLMQLIHKRAHRLVSFNSGLSRWSTASHVFFNSLIAPFRTQWGGTLSSVAELAHLVSWLVSWLSLVRGDRIRVFYIFL